MTRKRQRSHDSNDGPSPNPLQPSVGLNEQQDKQQDKQQDQLLEATAPEQEVADSDWLQLVADDGNSNVVRSIPTPLSSADGETKADVVVDQVAAPSRRAVVWFRRDLRLHDNLALDAAIRMQQQTLKAGEGEMALLPIYIVHRPVKQRCGPVRFQFLLEAVQDLADSIDKLQGRLLVLRGDAEEVLREVLPAWGITDLFFEAGVMPYAVARDERVRAIAAALNVTVATFRGVTLYDPHEIIRHNNGELPTDYEQLLKITNTMKYPARPIPAPEQLTNAARFTTEELFAMLEKFCHHNPRLANSIAGIEASTCTKKTSPELFVVPPLTAFGLTPPETHIFLYGGESEAMRLLNAFSQDQERVGLFEKPRTSPVTIDAPSTTSLSPYLVFGCLSAREFFNCIMVIQIQFPQRPGPTQVTLEGQLMWREFFYCYACGTPNFDSQERNPGCKQIKWRLRPENHEPCPEDGCERVSATDDADEKLAMHQLQCWKDGCTGFPWIDAVMRQINQEGWTHHAGRHAVACFLTRGILYISWLQGAMYFQEKLVDMDWALTVGNWLWVSASCFFSDYRRVASPSTFPQRWDKEGRFIRKYIPALRNMPDKFVFEPWKAPFKVQRDAGCLIGKDYPFPIVDGKHAVKRCITGMSHAYSDTESTTSETNTRADTDDPSSDESSPWSAGDMCYSYHTAATDSGEVQAPQASSAPASSAKRA
ncbi:hypothetical protein KRP22_000434 [Phytophthora ramorum]|nr:(6-4)DNA photolyase [Phytophthora ramorum]